MDLSYPPITSRDDPGGPPKATAGLVGPAGSARRWAWIVLILANIADGLTYCGNSAATVAHQEANPIARALGAGLLSVLGAKAVGGALMVASIYFFTRGGLPRWSITLLIIAFALLCFVGAASNVLFGWWNWDCPLRAPLSF